MENQTQASSDFKGSGALDAFLNLFSLITLGWMSISIGIMLFQFIDKFLSPGTVNSLSRYSQGGLKFGVASALIVTPIFLAIISSLHKKYKAGKLNPQSGVYRWLTYLILLVTGLNIIGRLIQLVFQLLDGDYTLPSILKIAVVLVIAGGIFGYYWYDLKRTDYSSRSKISTAFLAIVVIVTSVSIITSFFIIDNPREANMKKNDQQRVNDLSVLDGMISSYYREKGALPTDLTEPRFTRYMDPETNTPYDYSVLGEMEYELCATFSLASSQDDKFSYYADRDWFFHQGGYQCFTVTVEDALKYPVPVETFIR